MKSHKEILHFISVIRNSSPLMEHIFTQGSCGQFYLILRAFVGKENIVWRSNIDHIVSEINGHCYDISGEVDCECFPVKNEKRSMLFSVKHVFSFSHILDVIKSKLTL